MVSLTTTQHFLETVDVFAFFLFSLHPTVADVAEKYLENGKNKNKKRKKYKYIYIIICF